MLDMVYQQVQNKKLFGKMLDVFSIQATNTVRLKQVINQYRSHKITIKDFYSIIFD